MSAFEGQVAIVTGAGSGIGFAVAARLRDSGAQVVAADLHPDGTPPGTVPVAVDVSKAADVERMVSVAMGLEGRVDVLVNNAGVGSTTDTITCSEEEWDRLFAVNVRGVFLGTKAVLPGMVGRRSGVIVNTASVAGLVGLRDRAAYCATKGAVIAYTRQVAVQHAADNVRCNAVCPGTVDSPWVAGLVQAAPDAEGARAALVARQPLGRLGTPEEVAGAIVYLAGPEAAFITGSALVIDGGISAA